jgi:hypothetical protein
MVGKVGEWYVVSRHLQGCSTRLSRLRTDGLALASKYWTYRSHAGVYGPSKPSSWSPTGVWLTPPASLVGSGEKLGMDPQINQLACCGLCRKSFFSGAVGSVQICRRLAKGCYRWITWDMYGPGPYADWAWKSMWRVRRVFPCMVYICRSGFATLPLVLLPKQPVVVI